MTADVMAGLNFCAHPLVRQLGLNVAQTYRLDGHDFSSGPYLKRASLVGSVRECTDFGWIAHAFCAECVSRILEVAGLLWGFAEGCCGGWLLGCCGLGGCC